MFIMGKISYTLSRWSYYHVFKCIIVIVISIEIFSTVVAAASSTARINNKSLSGRKYLRVAKRLFREMDRTIEPCDNFYKFACGNFKKFNKISNTDYHNDRFVIGRTHIMADLYTVISNLDSKEKFKPFQLVKQFYDTCMNTPNIEQQGYEPLVKILKKLDGWPFLPTRWNKQMFSWEELINKIRKAGYSGDYFISLSLNIDPRNFTKLALNLYEPELELSYEQFSKGYNDSAVRAYYMFMINIAEILGAERTRAKRELAQVLDFEIRLSQIIKDSSKGQSSLKAMRLNDLKLMWPRINWQMLIKKVLTPYVTVYDDETVIVSNPNYITAFENLISKTPSKVQKNYALWKIIQTSIPYVSDTMQKELTIYKISRGDKVVKSLRSAICMLSVQKELKQVVDSLYIRNYVKRNTKNKITNMVNYVKREFANIINGMKWLDMNSKKYVTETVKNTTNFIAYADELLDDNKLKTYYRGLELVDADYLQSWLNINLFMMNKVCQGLKTTFNNTDWTILDTWTTVNARYVLYANRIELPAGILQPPFYEHNRPHYMNYGSIGSIIGHEFFHLFSSEHILFDQNNISDMKSLLAKRRYFQKVACLKNQYNNYTVEEIGEKVNGDESIVENIADGGGIRLAYLAYQKWISEHKQEENLPDLTYTPNQLFWISMANTFCSTDSPTALKLVNKNSNIPNEFRVIGALSNIPEFAADFKCPIGSRMNRMMKCRFW